MSEKQFDEEMSEFVDRRLAALRSEIDNLQSQFEASVNRGSEGDGESSRIFREAAFLRLEYTQLCADRPQRNGRWLPPHEPIELPATEFPATPPTKHQGMGFRKPPEPSAE